MGGLDDLLAESEDRWAKAERRAVGVADKGLGQTVKRYFTTYFFAGMLLLLAVGAGLGLLLFQGVWATTRSFLLAGTMLAYLGAIIGGIVYNAKAVGPAVEMGRINVLLSLEPDEQKQLRREILGKVPATSNHLAVKERLQSRHGKAWQPSSSSSSPSLNSNFLCSFSIPATQSGGGYQYSLAPQSPR